MIKRIPFQQTILLAAFLAGHVLLPHLEAAPAPKTYQVTGPILELTDKTIVVQKGDERWEIGRDENTKLKGDLKVGQKVTIHYRMTAATIEVKSSSPEPKGKTP